MEEVSSLDSFHTDDGEEVAARNDSVPPKTDDGGGDDDDDDNDNGDGDADADAEGEGDGDADGEADNVDNSGDGEEEFEQISEGTFDVDENSQAMDRTPADKDLEEAVQKTTDFEEIDANVSVNTNTSAAHTGEADMLGGDDADLTLPQKEHTIENKNDTIDTNKSSDSAGDMDVEQHEDVSGTGCDVEIHSTQNSPHSENDKHHQDHDESRDKRGDKDDYFTNEKPPNEKSGMASCDTNTDVGTNVVQTLDYEEENRNESVNNSTDDKYVQNAQSTTEQEGVTSCMGDDNCAGETEADVENAEDDDDEPVENVQEPEESDVCLIPDDTETEVTEAEKEKAILARKNAELEDGQTGQKSVENNIEAESTNKDIANLQEKKKEIYDNEDDKTIENDEGKGITDADDDVTNVAESLLEELNMDQLNETSSALATKIGISWTVSTLKKCEQCCEEKLCGFRFRNPGTKEFEYLCELNCCEALLKEQTDKYFIRRKKFLVEELQSGNNNLCNDSNMDALDTDGNSVDSTEQYTSSVTVDSTIEHNCVQCKETKRCKYFFKQDDEIFYFCNDDCYNLMNAEEPDKFKLKRHSIRVRNIGGTISPQSPQLIKKNSTTTTEVQVVARTAAEAETARIERDASYMRTCADCFEQVTLGGKNLQWETMDFCNEICLGKYQRSIGSHCQTCHGDVSHQALGKYCVRFGFDIRQFCCAVCLNEFKKGLKMCSCCQKDISGGNEGFLAPVGDKEQFKDFCSQSCMRRYDSMNNARKKSRIAMCAVCNTEKLVRIEVALDDKEHTFCSNPCFSAFKFVSNVVPDQCGMCAKYFERKATEAFTIYTELRPKPFCSRICLNVYIITNRRIVSCQWCKVKKYNFDMIYKQQDAQEILMCSLNCLTLYGVSINAFSRTIAKCDNCNASATPQYHLTMSDASMRNFCTYQCVMQFQSQFARAPLTLDHEGHSVSASTVGDASSGSGSLSTQSGNANNSAPFPTGLPKRVRLKHQQGADGNKNSSALKDGHLLPVIANVASLATGGDMHGNDITVRRGRCRGRKLDMQTGDVYIPPRSSNSTSTPSVPAGRGRPRKNVDYRPRSPSPMYSAISVVRSSSGGRRGTASTPMPTDTQIGTSRISETKIITVPPYPPKVRNVQTHCRPQTSTVGFQITPNTIDVGCQTDKDYSNKVLIPVPVPIYVPQPMYMYSMPFPVPVPIPLPIPVPIFIPTTRNSSQGILKEIKKIQDKMPADPFEAELLMMAEMVAEEKRESDSDSDEEVKPDPNAVPNLQYGNNMQSVDVSTNNAYGDDVLQMALKMATSEYDQPTVDLESAMTANTITHPPAGIATHDSSMAHLGAHQHHLQPQQHQQQHHHHQQTPPQQSQPHHMMEAVSRGRGRKRGAIATPVTPRNSRSPAKRQRLQEPAVVSEVSPTTTAAPTQPVLQQSEKPDANMCLKYTFGVNAWKQWVMTKNADEKSSMRRRTFKTELLQMTADELNYSLCLFVKEVRKPNGTEYAPDTIYYLVLGIQQYLYENGRIDNIFTDPYYERFTDCLDEVARKFSVLYNDSQYIVTRVEEEHLWECKQLGAHSPHVLLSTLMFFNTKHFNLTTVEEHMQLSFSHIMKHWKRSAQSAKTPGTRNVLLRFYPPQAGLDANPRKKKVYEQQENEDNPLRCPVRLYEFYLSKCPESVKTRNDVFYLQPERSCVPDSPVWYSTQALSQEALQKMLHRVKMVKEINIALLTS